MLKTTEAPLTDSYDVAVLDLDGVVYLGDDLVPAAAESLSAARDAGMHLAFVTNNAASTPADVASRLVGLGVPAAAEDVVTSAQACARLVAEAVPAGSRVYVIGGDGLEQALAERGLEAVTRADRDVAAVAQGYGPEMPWRQVVRGAMLVADGLPWLVSNTDMTLPTANGLGPGNGTLVKLVAEFSGRTPRVAGKPEPALFEETIDRVGGSRPLVVGDRIDTDIAGARRLGWDSLLVLTGVTGVGELVAVPERQRPAFLGADLATLAQPQPDPEEHEGAWRLGPWQAHVREGVLEVTGTACREEDRHHWWRCVAAAGWQFLDDTGSAARTDLLRPPGPAGR